MVPLFHGLLQKGRRDPAKSYPKLGHIDQQLNKGDLVVS